MIEEIVETSLGSAEKVESIVDHAPTIDTTVEVGGGSGGNGSGC